MIYLNKNPKVLNNFGTQIKGGSTQILEDTNIYLQALIYSAPSPFYFFQKGLGAEFIIQFWV